MNQYHDLQSIGDIVQAAKDIQIVISQITREEFFRVRHWQASILYEITIIGEAANRLSSDFKNEHAVIEWSEIIRMRNFVVHVYDQIDLGRVWFTAIQKVPELIDYFEPLLPFSSDDLNSKANNEE